MSLTTSDVLVRIPVHGAVLDGVLSLPRNAAGIVIFAHGSGSSRFSPRNEFLAAELQKAGFATLLFDLLTEAEAAEPDYRFNAERVGGRLAEVVRWAGDLDELRGLPVGLLGSSTGAAAALVAAAEPGSPVRALVLRGGRPELAGDAVEAVTAPTLLIVGGFDWAIIDLNETACERLKGTARLDVVEKATHLFEEEGALEEVARRTKAWFEGWLR